MAELQDRVVLVTGATGGLGPAVVDAFLEAGASVVGVGRQFDKRARERFRPHAADLSSPDAPDRAVRAAVEAFGRLDALVHVAGGFAGGSPVAETSDDVWEQMWTLNVRLGYRIFRAAIPEIVKSRHGRIIAVGSRAGVDPGPGVAAYSASKAALHSLVRTLALELRDQGVTVNAVLPSVIDTPANRQAMPKADFSTWVQPAVIAQQIVWLAGPQSQDVSGALLPIYGRA